MEKKKIFSAYIVITAACAFFSIFSETQGGDSFEWSEIRHPTQRWLRLNGICSSFQQDTGKVNTRFYYSWRKCSKPPSSVDEKPKWEEIINKTNSFISYRDYKFCLQLLFFFWGNKTSPHERHCSPKITSTCKGGLKTLAYLIAANSRSFSPQRGSPVPN